MHDLVIRHGTIVDGTGEPRFEGDVAVDGDRITQVGGEVGPGKREIDAKGKLVSPGFVDVHTHYDAQITWDDEVSPSSGHGVTTVVMGNCGVGFAPAPPDRRDWLIALMEGVEDIPGAAMHEGIQWAWESFPEYLDALEKRRCAVDFATQVPHGAVRAYVMGERGARNEEATADDIAAMARIVAEGVKAGALGFSTSRTLIHKSSDGEYVPGTFAAEDELFGIAEAMVKEGPSVLQMTSNHVDMPKELDWMERMVRDVGCTVSFNLLQIDDAPELWRDSLGRLTTLREEGLPIFAQVAGRPSGVLMCWEGTANPFLSSPTYLQMFHTPFEERLVELKKPEVRQAILDDEPISLGAFEDFILQSFDKMYRLGSEPDYDPDPSQSAAALAEAKGCSPREIVYDWLMEDEGRGVVYFPIFGFSHQNLDAIGTMLQHPGAVLGLADGGAHCGAIADVSMPTFMLTYWARDRQGEKMSVEQVIKGQTADTARLYGLGDRGQLAPGLRADLNVIDFERLAIDAPRIVYDLPAGGRRFIQSARGYDATVVAGEVVTEHDQRTAARPGRLIRGQR